MRPPQERHKRCAPCKKSHLKEYHKRYGAEYRKNNKEKENQRSREYYKQNKKSCLEYHKTWRLKNYIKKERKKKIFTDEEIKERKEKKKEYARIYYRNYYKKNISQKIALRFKQRLWRLLKGKKVKFKIEELIGCTKEYLVKYLENKFEKGMTWNNHGEWHIDHIKSCISFNLEDDNELKKCFNYTNLRPLWAIDNLKRAKK